MPCNAATVHTTFHFTFDLIRPFTFLHLTSREHLTFTVIRLFLLFYRRNVAVLSVLFTFLHPSCAVATPLTFVF
jgi:hypothetical protein